MRRNVQRNPVIDALTGAVDARLKKITVNVPVDVLMRACAITGRNITETIVEALRELDRERKRCILRALRGRVRVEVDLDKP